MLYQVRLVFGIGSLALLTAFTTSSPLPLPTTTTRSTVDPTVLRDLQMHRSLDDNGVPHPNIGDGP